MYEELLTRRSVRRYQPRQVEDADLDKVLQAGLYAPTAKNNQKPVMVAVRDQQTRDQMSRMNAAVMGVESDPFYGAPCVIVVLADPEIPTWQSGAGKSDERRPCAGSGQLLDQPCPGVL